MSDDELLAIGFEICAALDESDMDEAELWDYLSDRSHDEGLGLEHDDIGRVIVAAQRKARMSSRRLNRS